jgi:drug/metabolite transporter (DMT)-like permease
MYFCALLSWIAAPFYDGAFPAMAFTEARPIFSIIYLAVFSSSIAFLLQNVGQKYTPPTTAALLMSLESLFGALFSALFLGEKMTARMIAGCALLFFAIVLSQLEVKIVHRLHR